MTYFEDLSHYTYHVFARTENGLPLVNVGWLDLRLPYRQGQVDPTIAHKIGELCQNPVNQTRGFHNCQLCREYPVKETLAGQKWGLGSAEVHIVGDGKVYAAPTLIYHYIVRHNYLPPEEFLVAVAKIAS